MSPPRRLCPIDTRGSNGNSALRPSRVGPGSWRGPGPRAPRPAGRAGRAYPKPGALPVFARLFRARARARARLRGQESIWDGAVQWLAKAMRVALKLVLATVLGTLAVLIIFGWLRARREVE